MIKSVCFIGEKARVISLHELPICFRSPRAGDNRLKSDTVLLQPQPEAPISKWRYGEIADAQVSKTCGGIHVGASPSTATNLTAS